MRNWMLLLLGVTACTGAGNTKTAARDTAAAPATPTIDEATARADLEKIQKDWVTAFVAHDTTFFARLFAEDVTVTGPDGVSDRATQVRSMGDTTMGVKVLGIDNQKIRLYDDNKVGVVTGVARLLFTQGKQQMPAALVYTETYVHQNGRWQLIAAHFSQAPPK